MAFTRVNGIVLHHRVAGRHEGPALVFINSLGSDHRIWSEVAARFEDRYRLVLYDKRGHGLSDAPDGDYSIADHANDLLALLDHLRSTRPPLWACRSAVSLRSASRSTFRTGCGRSCFATPRRNRHRGHVAERIAAVEGGGIEAIIDGVMQRWFTPSFRETQPDDWAGWRNMVLRTPPPGYMGTCAALRDADLTDDVVRIRSHSLPCR